MKNLSRIIAVLCLLAALSLSACAKAPAENSTETAVTATQSPTETPATIAPTTAPSTDAPAQNTAAEHPTDSDPSPISLSGTRWNLSMVYADGEEQRPSVRYGSVIRQTGAYITFDSDNTFNCVLGLVGCTGTYSTSDSGTTLHITTRYDGTSENGERPRSSPSPSTTQSTSSFPTEFNIHIHSSFITKNSAYKNGTLNRTCRYLFAYSAIS